MATAVANGGAKTPATTRVMSVYSEVQTSRLNHTLPLPSVLRAPYSMTDGPPSSAAGNPGMQLKSGSESLSLYIYISRSVDRICNC